MQHVRPRKTIQELVKLYTAPIPEAYCSEHGSGASELSTTGHAASAGADQRPSWELLIARVHAIASCVAQTCTANKEAIDSAIELLFEWIEDEATVRVLGAGRALLAAAMAGNRLAHAGVQISFMGGVVPLPNSERGGGLIACSASGKTVTVLEAMRIAKRNNPGIQVIGIAAADANEFSSLCDSFIGIERTAQQQYPNPLSALADTEEYVIAEILDGLVVRAGQLAGFDDNAWRRGHEDIGPTGPYAPKQVRKS